MKDLVPEETKLMQIWYNDNKMRQHREESYWKNHKKKTQETLLTVPDCTQNTIL